jgi:hypothetical protein
MLKNIFLRWKVIKKGEQSLYKKQLRLTKFLLKLYTIVSCITSTTYIYFVHFVQVTYSKEPERYALPETESLWYMGQSRYSSIQPQVIFDTH